MDALARVFLYGGLSEEEYDAIRNDIVEANLRNLLIYTPIACAVFLLLTVASTITKQGPPSSNQAIYFVSCLFMGGIAISIHRLKQDVVASKPHLVTILSHVFILVLHAFSISLSIAHPEYPAVSAIVFLLVNPLLFFDRPIRAMAMTMVATAAIVVTSLCFKDAILALDDTWNAVTFGMVALAVDTLNMRSKLTQLFQAQEIAYLSKTDMLTQLRNRNNYESRLEGYPTSGAQVLICVYVDANGLRELNNTEGHEAGDELLRTIARQMRKSFGEKNTYRIGGDEFVAFALDGSADDTRRKLQRMQDKLATKGYSVSYGVSEAEAVTADMRALVRAAEKEMYEQKRLYHANDSIRY